MDTLQYSHQQLISMGKLSLEDMEQVSQCRRPHNRLGFAYQLAFVRLANRFPSQQPFEVTDDILTFVCVQLDIPSEAIHTYEQRQPTLSEHQERIRAYLKLRRFRESEMAMLRRFLFEEASRLDQTSALLARAEQFLKEQRILKPAEDTLRRLIATQRKQARQHIFDRITGTLPSDLLEELDALLITEEGNFSELQSLKETPGLPSPTAMLRLIHKLKRIRSTGILTVDLSWLSNNYQRSLTRYVKRCSADRLRRLQPIYRHAILVCFLWQVYRSTVDHIVDMHDKIITRTYGRAQKDMDEQAKKRRNMLRSSLLTLQTLAQVVLDESIDDADLREILFRKVAKKNLAAQVDEIETWLSGKYSHVFNLVIQRISYLRQFSPAMLENMEYQLEDGNNSALLEAIQILRDLNRANKRKLPEDAPVGFVPEKIKPLVISSSVDKPAWECALLTAIRDEIRAGNVFVLKSNRFGKFDDFFIPEMRWHSLRSSFFKRAGLPERAEHVQDYLTERLNKAYDQFLEHLPENTYAKVDEDGWHLSVDSAEKLGTEAKHKLESLNQWLSENLRVIKLPELLIEVDNELRFTRHFITPAQQRRSENVCAILATVMAHGCNIGPYTMSQLTPGIDYKQLKHITDWQLTDETQRSALAQVVNAISNLDVTQAWGKGKTSSSDGQRFRLKRKVLQRTYSHRFRDFALEFYSFVADNYAPFYSIPIECANRDAAYVLDGLLYNESDLELGEHYTDTHGYTEINFAAFAMLGRRFAPRIRGIQHQRIYRIDRNKDYGALSSMVGRQGHTIHADWICEQWDRMGHFYASLESGHVTASTALKRLVSYSSRNHFYRANRELGRVIKSEYILQYMSDPLARQRARRGLLKGEQMHALAREVGYGKHGKINTRDLQEQRNSCSCLTLIMACIIYWQAKEINRVLNECDPEAADIDVSLIEHISPVGWENIVLYGEYVLNQELVML